MRGDYVIGLGAFGSVWVAATHASATHRCGSTLKHISVTNLSLYPSTPLSNSPNPCRRFLPVALQWTRALLAGVDKQHHGIDLFGRDAFLLGRLLGTLGSFLEASAGSRESVGLAAAALEVAKARPVQEHAEPFVRRGAILAAAGADFLGP